MGRCPNLLAEAGLYRYADGESPESDHNHALDALRYLISRIDERRMASLERRPDKPPPPKSGWLNEDNEALWVPFN